MLKRIENADKKTPLLDGLLKKNTVLISGLIVAPVVFVTNTLSNALALIFAFSVITLFTIIISSFIPRNIVYTIRIILYTIIAALVYVPVYIIEQQLFPDEVVAMGIMLPLLITNSLILTKAESRFLRQPKGRMVFDLLSYILGFDAVAIVIGFIREVFGTGELGGSILGIPLTFPILVYPFGGFILLGLLSALYKKLLSVFSE